MDRPNWSGRAVASDLIRPAERFQSGWWLLAAIGCLSATGCFFPPPPVDDGSAKLASIAPVRVATPSFIPNGGSFVGSVDVEITCATVGAAIRYTTDGSSPTSSQGTVYDGPIRLTETATLTAVAYWPTMVDSDVASASFEIAAGGQGCAGQYQGTFDGDDQGTIAVTIAASGRLDGTWSDGGEGSGTISGSLSADGSISARGTPSNITASGQFDFTTCTAKGNWSDAAGGRGTWTLSRSP